MPEPDAKPFTYLILRVVPSVERGERFNVGVVLFCRQRGFLGARIELDAARLAALAPGVPVEEVRGHLAALVRVAEGAPVGHVAFLPGRRRSAGEPGGDWRSRELVPGLAHLWQLFVLPDWWGRGVAPVLHDQAVSEMCRRGFEQARLYTPSQQARARRFYERRGWSPRGDLWNHELQLELTEYKLTLKEAGNPRRRPGPSAEPAASSP